MLGAPRRTRRGQLWPLRAGAVPGQSGRVAGGSRRQRSVLTAFTVRAHSLLRRDMGDFWRANHR